MRLKSYIFILIFCFIFGVDSTFSQRSRNVQTTRTITFVTQPNATIWIDGIKRGITDEVGKLTVKPVVAGNRKLRVRADGFKEISKSLLSTQRGTVRISLLKTTDKAELAFQEAEKIAVEDKQKATELYKKAIRLRPRYSQAFLGLARVLSSNDSQGALKAIADARKIRPIFPEASAVEGRIFKSLGEIDKAIDSFDRAIREGRGFQPEAYTGLGLIFKEEAEDAKTDDDFEEEKYYYTEAAKSFEKAINQLSATEPVVYLLLGEIYEKMKQRQKAITVYQRYLRDFPEGDERSAVQSFIVQLRKEMRNGQL